MNYKELAQLNGISRTTYLMRLNSNWTPYRAATQPVDASRNPGRKKVVEVTVFAEPVKWLVCPLIPNQNYRGWI